VSFCYDMVDVWIAWGSDIFPDRTVVEVLGRDALSGMGFTLI
jgi:hypothetical protein